MPRATCSGECLPKRPGSLDRVAGILLTAVAVILLANGFTDLVTARLRR